MEKLNQEKPSQGVKDQNEGLCPRFHASVYAMCILQGAAGEGSELRSVERSKERVISPGNQARR